MGLLLLVVVVVAEATMAHKPQRPAIVTLQAQKQVRLARVAGFTQRRVARSAPASAWHGTPAADRAERPFPAVLAPWPAASPVRPSHKRSCCGQAPMSA